MAQIRLLLDYDPHEATQAEADGQIRAVAYAEVEWLRKSADALPGVSVSGWDVDLIRDPDAEVRRQKEGAAAILAVASLYKDLLDVQRQADAARADDAETRRAFYAGTLSGSLLAIIRSALLQYYLGARLFKMASAVQAIDLFGLTEAEREREKIPAAGTA